MKDEALRPERTALEDLTHLARATVTERSLEECSSLVQMFMNELGGFESLSDGGRIKTLNYVLSAVASEARRGSLQGTESAFQVAAAAELMGLSDAEEFQRKRAGYIRDAATWERMLDENNRGAKGERQLRAGVWIKTGAQGPKRKESVLLSAFESAFKVYVASHQDELRELMNSHLAAPIPAQSTQQSDSPNLATTSPPAAKPPRKRLLLSLSTAFVVTVGALGVWWQWPAEKAEAVPLNVNATWPLARGCDGGTTVAMQPGGAELRSFGVPKTEDVRTKIVDAKGGGSWRAGHLIIDLSGKTDEPVQIRNITHKKLQSNLPAPEWIYEPRGGCGGGYYRNFVLDLDGGRLFDKGLVGEASMLTDGETPPPTEPIGPAFTVSRSDPAQITVNTLSCEGNYEWMFFIDWVQGSNSGRLTLGPYRSMGVAKNTERYFSTDGKTYESDGKFSGSEQNWCKQFLG
ncbi:hypothetical protein ACKI1J_14390 [Streptomyces scabiei]|uniref:hypothetical protein n=1 Tax=Streptomyces scabiei TaxID=1930 RepID=UPI0038F7504E